MRLSNLIAYKAMYFALGAGAHVDEHAARVREEIADALAAIAGAVCVDTDPRSLPFIPFDLGGAYEDDLALDADHGRDAFRATYGPHRDRTDASGVGWKLDPRAYHGQDVLTVKGRALPGGFHWDVAGPRGGTHLVTAAEVWHVKRNQYLNVYPDNYVRTTRDGGRRIWPDAKK